MPFLASLCLMLVSVVFLAIGFTASLSWAFIAAALISAVAVVILWRRVSAEKEHVFLSNPPERREPKVAEPFIEPAVSETDEVLDLEEVRTIGIPGYDHLVASEVLPSLETLSVEQLRAVIARERRGQRRGSIIQRAQKLIELTGAAIEPSSLASATTPGRNRRTQERSNDGPEMSL